MIPYSLIFLKRRIYALLRLFSCLLVEYSATFSFEKNFEKILCCAITESDLNRGPPFDHKTSSPDLRG